MGKGGSAARRGPRQAPRGTPRRRDEVIETAERILAERGYEATTMEEIATALDMLKGSLYYYVPSKAALLEEIVSTYHTETSRYFEEIVNADLPPLDKIRALVVAQTVHTARNQVKADLFYTEWRSLSGETKADLLKRRRVHEEAVAEWILLAQRAGTVRKELDPKVTTYAVLGMVNSVYRWFSPNGRLSADAVAELFADIVISGLVPAA